MTGPARRPARRRAPARVVPLRREPAPPAELRYAERDDPAVVERLLDWFERLPPAPPRKR